MSCAIAVALIQSSYIPRFNSITLPKIIAIAHKNVVQDWRTWRCHPAACFSLGMKRRPACCLSLAPLD